MHRDKILAVRGIRQRLIGNAGSIRIKLRSVNEGEMITALGMIEDEMLLFLVATRNLKPALVEILKNIRANDGKLDSDALSRMIQEDLM